MWKDRKHTDETKKKMSESSKGIDIVNNKKIKLDYNDLFIENCVHSRSTVKNYIIKNNLLKYVCSDCKQDEYWRGKKISLILDHINGIYNDNRIENLRFMCPNCNATLNTHCKRNYKHENI